MNIPKLKTDHGMHAEAKWHIGLARLQCAPATSSFSHVFIHSSHLSAALRPRRSSRILHQTHQSCCTPRGSCCLASIIDMLVRYVLGWSRPIYVSPIPFPPKRICCQSGFDPEEWPLTSEDAVRLFPGSVPRCGCEFTALSWGQ